MLTCTVCGVDKTPYEFPVKKRQPLVCFDCDGDVECVYCGEKKHPYNFRVMGRVCRDCKIQRRMKISQVEDARFAMLSIVDTLNHANRSEMRKRT